MHFVTPLAPFVAGWVLLFFTADLAQLGLVNGIGRPMPMFIGHLHLHLAALLCIHKEAQQESYNFVSLSRQCL